MWIGTCTSTHIVGMHCTRIPIIQCHSLCTHTHVYCTYMGMSRSTPCTVLYEIAKQYQDFVWFEDSCLTIVNSGDHHFTRGDHTQFRN